MSKPNNTKTKREFNLTISRAYQTGSGGFRSVDIGDEELAALSKIEKGGRLVLKPLKPEQRKSDKSPNAYFEYMSPKQVQEFKEWLASKKQQSSSEDLDV